MTLRSTDYALLSQDSYKDPVVNKPITLDGIIYRSIDHADNPRTGFHATAYERMDTHEVVIAYWGTEFDREPVLDGLVDAGMAVAGVNAQTPDAMAFTQRVMDRTKVELDAQHRNSNVTVTGHSLGGTLAEIMAATYNLHGETFNAYGAAGLMQGVPQGSQQVIDHVRAGDVVSAASPHFGEVRIYAAPQDIDTLDKTGYRYGGSLLSLRNPIKAIDFSAHSIDNFVPESKTLGHSIISPESQARYRAHAGVIDRYRNDIQNARSAIALPGEAATFGAAVAIGTEKEMKLGVQVAGHVVHEAYDAAHGKVVEGVHAVQREVQNLTHETVQTFEATRYVITQGAHVVAHEVQSMAHTVDGEMMQGLHAASHGLLEAAADAARALHAAALHLHHPVNPDHAMFQQSRSAVQQIDAQYGRTPDKQSDQLAAALVLAAKRESMTRIYSVFLSEDGSRAFAMQGKPDLPLRQFAHVQTADAVNTPIYKSRAAAHAVNQQQTQQPSRRRRNLLRRCRGKPATFPDPPITRHLGGIP